MSGLVSMAQSNSLDFCEAVSTAWLFSDRSAFSTCNHSTGPKAATQGCKPKHQSANKSNLNHPAAAAASIAQQQHIAIATHQTSFGLKLFFGLSIRLFFVIYSEWAALSCSCDHLRVQGAQLQNESQGARQRTRVPPRHWPTLSVLGTNCSTAFASHSSVFAPSRFAINTLAGCASLNEAMWEASQDC